MKPELLAPAGNLKKLKLAFYYGADAVYLGGKDFSLRTFADNFTDEELAEGIAYAHARGKRVYAAVNIFARNADFAALERHLKFLEEAGADGVLVSDPGVFRLARRTAPKLGLHISTQANTLNAEAAAMWRELGAKRVVLARELSLEEIAEIHIRVPDLELEAFVHGAMCISYSGRCYLSDYIEGRSSNRGACAQPCRNAYEIRAKGKDGAWLPLEENGRGAYLLNSKDLNMARSLDELAAAGVCSFKLEGRMKSEYYLATVVNSYRRISDMGWSESLSEELDTLTHREYTTAFAFGENNATVSPKGSQAAGTCDFIAIVKGYEDGRARTEMRSRFYEGDVLEVLSPSENFAKRVTVTDLRDAEGNLCPDAKLVQAEYSFSCPLILRAGDILRRRRVHRMMLQPAPFALVKAGKKTVELRLNDEKRRAIKVGDCIEFTETASKEKLRVSVEKLYPFASFEELYKAIRPEVCGYEKGEPASPHDMDAYYSPEAQEKYGVLGIEVKMV